ncbi:hypothetical protein Ahy_A02g007135 isoform A [Arachis hypogaea]|uniref:Transposase MuDR plant domain-containing protein n=1 Tax=Arachis hypogaea TaxID=3818 RepID=A0A445EBV1_ARAHY|nr:hypothetical protein Ahy_A02g007135 isoform A [Arachis hypogaea]
MEVKDDESDEEYVVDSHESSSSNDDNDDEFILETLVGGSVPYLLPALSPIPEFRSKEAVMQSVKNYRIWRSAEYRVVESDQLNHHLRCR